MAKNNESPVLMKPTDETLLLRLAKKLKEYKSRMDEYAEYRHPELAYGLSSGYRDSLFKTLVLEKLLTDGQVTTWEFSRELAEKYKPFDVEKFTNACGVIAVYIGQSDDKPWGGTGLPEVA